MSPEPFTTIFSLMLFTADGCIVAFWFDVKDSWKGYLVVLLSVINTAVCAMLSYRYMPPTFAVSYLFSIFGVWVIQEKQSSWRMLAAVLFITLSLGCYQSNLGCTCLLVLLHTAWLLQQEENDTKQIVRFVLSAIVVIAASCLMYKIVWILVLKVRHFTVAGYNGADQVSFAGIITSFPATFVHTYKAFFQYFFTDAIKHNAYQTTTAYKMVFALLITIVLISGVIKAGKKSVLRAGLFAFCIFLVPLADNIALVLAPDSEVLIQMTMPMEITVPFLVCIVRNELLGKEIEKMINIACPVLMSALLLGSFLMISVDQHVMLVGRNASVSLLTRAIQGIDYDNVPEELSSSDEFRITPNSGKMNFGIARTPMPNMGIFGWVLTVKHIPIEAC